MAQGRMHCLITHGDAEGLAFFNFGLDLHLLFVYTSSEGSGKSTYTHARLSLHCSTLRQVPKSYRLAPLFYSFVTSKSILFNLKYAKY